MSDILELLDSWGIVYQKFEHEAFFTCEDASLFASTHIGGHAKNLFLRNKNSTQHYLFIIPAAKRINLVAAAHLVHESKLSFASEERLLQYLKLTPGSVSPFGLINDSDHHIKVLIDVDLWQQETFYFHPNRNTASLAISRESFQEFLIKVGNSWEVVTFAESSIGSLS